MLILHILFALPALARPPCPKVTCNPASEGVCAQLTNEGFSLNENLQGSGQQCRLYDIFPEYWKAPSNESAGDVDCPRESQPCVRSSPITESALDSDIGVACPIRINATDFKNITSSGTWNMSVPKPCNTKRNCEQLDGVFAPCVCGLDSHFYCLPNQSSSAFEFFWEECGMYESFARFWVWRKWQYGSMYWVMNATMRGSCVTRLIEIAIMRSADAVILLSASAILSLISL